MTTQMSAHKRRPRLPRNTEVQIVRQRIRTSQWPPVWTVYFTMRTGDAPEIYWLEVGVDGNVRCSCKDFMDRQPCEHAEKLKRWLEHEAVPQQGTEAGQILLAHEFLQMRHHDN